MQEAPYPNQVLFTADIPVESHYSKKNSKIIGYRGRASQRTPFILSNDHVRASEARLVLCLQQRARDIYFHKPIGVPVHLLCVLQFDNFYTQKGQINLRSGDLSNILQGVEDSLQKAEIIEDDALIVSIRAIKLQGPNNISIKLFRAELQDLLIDI